MNPTGPERFYKHRSEKYEQLFLDLFLEKPESLERAMALGYAINEERKHND